MAHSHLGIKCPSPRKTECEAKTREWKAQRKAASVEAEELRVGLKRADLDRRIDEALTRRETHPSVWD